MGKKIRKVKARYMIVTGVQCFSLKMVGWYLALVKSTVCHFVLALFRHQLNNLFKVGYCLPVIISCIRILIAVLSSPF